MALGEVKGIILSAGVSASHLDIPSTITRNFNLAGNGKPEGKAGGGVIRVVLYLEISVLQYGK